MNNNLTTFESLAADESRPHHPVLHFIVYSLLFFSLVVLFFICGQNVRYSFNIMSKSLYSFIPGNQAFCRVFCFCLFDNGCNHEIRHHNRCQNLRLYHSIVFSGPIFSGSIKSKAP